MRRNNQKLNRELPVMADDTVKATVRITVKVTVDYDGYCDFFEPL